MNGDSLSSINSRGGELRVYSVCRICGRPYAGLNCLKCTQAAITLVNFGDETLGRAEKQACEIVSKAELIENCPKLKLPNGQLFAVSKPICRIGEDSSNDIVINQDESTARFHAQISFDAAESEYVLRDLGTREGTYLNGAQIHLDEALYDGDMIKIGKHKFYFVSDLKD